MNIGVGSVCASLVGRFRSGVGDCLSFEGIMCGGGLPSLGLVGVMPFSCRAPQVSGAPSGGTRGRVGNFLSAGTG